MYIIQSYAYYSKQGRIGGNGYGRLVCSTIIYFLMPLYIAENRELKSTFPRHPCTGVPDGF